MFYIILKTKKNSVNTNVGQSVEKSVNKLLNTSVFYGQVRHVMKSVCVKYSI
jgi:hypothetical protein